MSVDHKNMNEDKVAIFQDWMLNNSEDLDGPSAAESMFEIANASHVGYRITKDVIVSVRQDLECQEHTGGIVWETSYLLANYLLVHYSNDKCTTSKIKCNHDSHSLSKRVRTKRPLGRVLEVGAGCGLLGLILAASKLSSKVVVTEANEALPNLQNNIDRNKVSLKKAPDIDVMQLRWDYSDEDIVAGGSMVSKSFDCIVGTDVIFRKDLVRPLLKTLHRLSDSSTTVFICVQERCSEAHAEFLRIVIKYFSLVDRTKDLLRTPGCEWGVSDLDSQLFVLTDKVDRKGNRKKRKLDIN